MRSVWGSSVVTLLVAASPGAFAADMRPAMVPPPVYNWTGFYVGGNLGGAWAHTTLTDDFTGQSFVGGTIPGLSVGARSAIIGRFHPYTLSALNGCSMGRISAVRAVA